MAENGTLIEPQGADAAQSPVDTTIKAPSSVDVGQVVHYLLLGLAVIIIVLLFTPGGATEVGDMAMMVVKIIASAAILYLGFMAIKQLK